jgi:ribonuclease HI
MGLGALILKDESPVFEKSDYVPAKFENSNNVAEYMAFIHTLDWLIENDLKERRIVVYGDSMLVVRQMNGEWRIKEGRYVEWAKKAKAKLAGVK